jgi:hypothetical protein
MSGPNPLRLLRASAHGNLLLESCQRKYRVAGRHRAVCGTWEDAFQRKTEEARNKPFKRKQLQPGLKLFLCMEIRKGIRSLLHAALLQPWPVFLPGHTGMRRKPLAQILD